MSLVFRRRRRVASSGEASYSSNDLASLPRAQERVLRSYSAWADVAQASRAVYPGALLRARAARAVVVPRVHAARSAALRGQSVVFGIRPPPIGGLRGRMPSFGLQVRAPSRARFCLQRKQRKEVLFAYGVAGRRGVGRGKRWNRNANSQWRC